MPPDLNIARQFLCTLDPVAARFAFRTFADKEEIKTDKGLIRSLPNADLEAGLRQLADLNAAGAGCFVTISATDGTGCKKENVTSPRALFADFDDAGTAADQVAAASALLPPSMVVESSLGKFHAYWLLDDLPLERLEPWLRHLIGKFGSDGKCKDSSRVLRLPGFWHQKGEPFMTRLISCCGQRYTEADLIGAFGEPVSAPLKGSTLPRPVTGRSGDSDIRLIPKGGRNAALVKEAGSLRRRGYGTEAIYASLAALNENQFEEPVPDTEVRAVAEWGSKFDPTPGADITEARGADAWLEEIEDADGDAGATLAVARRLVADPTLSRTETEALIKRAAKSAGVSVKVLRADVQQDDRDAARPVIEVRKSDFSASVDSALRVLPAVPGLRQRAGELVEVVVHPEGAHIQQVSAARLAYLISSSARWRYGTEDGPPDPSVLQAVMAAGAWPGVLPLSGVLVQPTITAIGEIIAEDGHHADSHQEGVFEPGKFPSFEGTAAEAMAALRGLLREFTFADRRDEAATLAAILTAVARPMLPTAPGFLVTASDLGSGKTYLAQLIAEFAGGASSLLRWPNRGEEQDKVLLSLLLEGRAVILFDNLMRNWSSPTLAAILTAPKYGDRILGGNGMGGVSTRNLFLATGNQVAPAADLSRRVVTIELDPKVEKPWNRSFENDPLATVQAERGKWVMIALRVLEDFLQTGEAPKLEPLASYGEWSRIVRGAIVTHGLPDPVAAVTRNAEDDEDRDLLDRVLWSWNEAFGTEMFTAKELVSVASTFSPGDPRTALRHVLEEIAQERGEINLRTLGAWFRSNAGRIVDGRRLMSGGKGRDGKVWYVGRV